MTCNCNALKAEVFSQRALMAEWFQTLLNEIRQAKAELIQIIESSTLNWDQQQLFTDQPLTRQPSSIVERVEPVSSSAFLETVHSPLPYSAAASDSNSVPLSPEQTRKPEMEQTSDPTIGKDLISPKIEPVEEMSAELNLRQNEDNDETLDKPAKATSTLIQFSSLESACSSAIVKTEQIETVAVEKPFACDKCEFRCADERILLGHKRSYNHNAKPMLKCHLCLKEFWVKQNLKSHMLVHNRKFFDCGQCAFQCRRTSDLIRHKLRHLKGRKPFACDQCAFSANHKSELNWHELVHKPKRFACDQCDFRTDRKINFANHQQKVHQHSGNLITKLSIHLPRLELTRRNTEGKK